MTANDDTPSTRRLFITDRGSQAQYLIDTGADLCVYSCTSIRDPVKKSTYKLAAANDSTMITYGSVDLTLNLELRRSFSW